MSALLLTLLGHGRSFGCETALYLLDQSQSADQMLHALESELEPAPRRSQTRLPNDFWTLLQVTCLFGVREQEASAAIKAHCIEL
jgi:hypothetical protein